MTEKPKHVGVGSIVFRISELVEAGGTRAPLTRPSRTPLGILVETPDNITHWR